MTDQAAECSAASRIEIKGIVQGVGFRPFVYQLARRWGLKGRVANTASGVAVQAEGPGECISGFIKDIRAEKPPLAQITEIRVSEESPCGFVDFEISKSRSSSHRSTLISPDISVCSRCLQELFDPRDRRYRYPFINCTNCGPRYTIIKDIPYDRPSTTMKNFAMCSACAREYEDPGDRRFHAQPNACPECGPRVRLFDSLRNEVPCADPSAAASVLLKKGFILAVKGLGGFHLAVDASDNHAVKRLRAGKKRDEKPFALMSPDADTVRKYAAVRPGEKELLESMQRPIVLLKKLFPSQIAPSVAPENRCFGVMLPYTPLHYLLFGEGFTALVMTSANLSEEPIVIDNREAFKRLSGIADYLLVHNRDICTRSDDSIVRHAAGSLRFIRRSRGWVPAPVFLKKRVPRILACGADLKNTICLADNSQAFLSQHIGDLENPRSLDFFKSTISHLERILDIKPEIVACDMHPGYMSTKYALGRPGAETVQVQHHHAHIAACMAENRIDGEVIGLSLDGTGFGTDGRIWGGEVLAADERDFYRAARLSYVPMPGGDSAAREPWRMAVSCLEDALGGEFMNLDLPLFKAADRESIGIIRRMIQRGINCPLTSSLGRLFDAVSAILGIRRFSSFEGQAAMALETAAPEDVFAAGAGPYECSISEGPELVVSVKDIISGVAEDLRRGASCSEISGRFHLSIIHTYAELCSLVRARTGLDRVVLSGGVFQNKILLEGLIKKLEKDGFRVFSHRLVPANDGGISLGQAVVAAARAGFRS